MVAPTARAEETAAEEDSESPLPSDEPSAGAPQNVKDLWEELRPGQRDWVFFGIGAGIVILGVLFVTLLTGIRFVNVVCLLTGGVLSFLVERLLALA